MLNYKRYTVTAALPYANGPLHIGHIAGAYLPADIFVRYLRAQNKDVLFLCGSDEHGAAITIKAIQEKTSPQAIIDKYHHINKKVFEDFGISFDVYHRTSDPLHHETAQDFFKKLQQNDTFIVEKSEQYFDEEHQQFLADRYITGTCPHCKFEKAYGDQCESCGRTLNPKDLIHPTSTLSGKKPVLKETQHWYFPLNEYENFLQQWIVEGKKDQWKANVYGQCKSWIDSGLQPRAMTRDLNWGVKVPLPNAEGKVLYVWLDAPIGYISATKHWAKNNNKSWEEYWKSQDTALIHFIGKDNIVFHCIIFPSLLKAHGEYILPENVPANEFLNLEGSKISTSRNHAVWLHEYLQDFPNKQDELRYVLCSIAPEAKDSEFIWVDFQSRVNNELVAILGNFVNRTFVLIEKYYEGVIPKNSNPLSEHTIELTKEIEILEQKIERNITKYKFRDALFELMNIARLGNKYLADHEPWKLIKTDPEQVKNILSFSAYIVQKIAVISEPFLPNTAKKLKNALQLPITASLLEYKNTSIEQVKITNPGLLFEKIEDETIQKQLKKLEKPFVEEALQVKTKPNISFDDFTKLDIRVGLIIDAEKIEKADKLLKLTIDTGLDKRTVVSGIAQHYSPEQIVGKKVSVLLNLEPRKIRGVESHGMILMAEDEGKLCFILPSENVKPGSEIR